MSSILIIGGNSDIGYATSKIFAKNKYNIHLAYGYDVFYEKFF